MRGSKTDTKILFVVILLSLTGSCSLTKAQNTSGIPSQGVLKPQPIQEITPASQFFVIQYDGTPKINANTWRLKVSGRVSTPLNLSLAEVNSMPQTEQIVTLECIENGPGGDLISTGRWGGVLLKDLFARARVQGTPKSIIFRAADGYEESVPYSLLARTPVMLVMRLNGSPLPQVQGYPARLIIPGLYGMKNVKWVTSIELSQNDFNGYWEKQGWSKTAEVFVKSWIYRVDRVAGSTDHSIRGIAYAGMNKINKVEVSLDGGRTWRAANIDKVVAPYAVTIWSYRWQNPRPGTYQLAVRATDSAGRTQPAVDRDYRDGNNGIQSVAYNLQ